MLIHLSLYQCNCTISQICINKGTIKKKVRRALESHDVPLEPYIFCPATRQYWSKALFKAFLSFKCFHGKMPHTE